MLDGHFGHAREFAIIVTDNSRVISNERKTPPPHEPGSIPRWLDELKVTDVISGGMGQRAVENLGRRNIHVHKGAPTVKVSELIDQFLQGTLILDPKKCHHH